MKTLNFVPLLLLAAVSCTTGTSKQSSPAVEKSTPTPVANMSLNVANLDVTADPGTDFYQYATGGWRKANPLTDEYARYGTFDQLAENNTKQIKSLILDLSSTPQAEGSIGNKIGTLYSMAIDSVTRNKQGAEPIKAELAAISAAKTTKDIVQLLGQIRHYARDPFFGMGVGADDKNSNVNIVSLAQGGLGMGDRDYYLNKDSKALRDGYVKLIANQFVNAGYAAKDAQVIAFNVMKIETALAQSHITKEARRIPENNYHKIATADLNKKVGKFDWKTFFEASGFNKPFSVINVMQVAPLSAAIKLINNTPIEQTKQYLAWCVINSASGDLGDNFYTEAFDFYGKQMSGQKVPRPRWKRAVRATESAMGEAVGQMYVQKYFSAESKARMLKLVNNLKTSLKERIQNSAWMSDATKAKAEEKLSAFIVKIGYPDKFRDYSGLQIKNDSYYANMKRAQEFEYDYDISQLDKPVDKMKWGMTPQTVNAYYEPTTNEICFPAGILQPPFFYPNADDAVNYGAIGVVIGHEMTHGFDDQGCKYDKNGNMENWWTAVDTKKFNERTAVLRDHFNSIVVLDSIHANGVFTLGENIADQGGLQVSYNAFLKTDEAKSTTKIDGFTPQQRFFLAYANVWAQNIRDAQIKQQTKSDPHALGKWRVDGALPQIDAWYQAFNITDKAPLYIPKEKRVAIW